MKYELIYSNRKSIAIQITEAGKVVVRAPKRCSKRVIEQFLNEKRFWIDRHIADIARQDASKEPPFTEAEIACYKKLARQIFNEKAAYYANIMGVSYNRIAIREQRTRWGSCSSQGNLNFNWRLVLAPVRVLDYVVIHELAHRREMNHSSRFYAIVEAVMPEYRIWKKWLADHGRELWRR